MTSKIRIGLAAAAGAVALTAGGASLYAQGAGMYRWQTARAIGHLELAERARSAA